MTNRLIYLASPYSNKNTRIQEMREMTINEIGARLLSKGWFIYGPITMSAPLARTGHMKGGDWETWKALDLLMIDKSDEVWVADMQGWQDSVGVQAEIAHAHRTGKTVFLLDTKMLIESSRVSLHHLKETTNGEQVQGGTTSVTS